MSMNGSDRRNDRLLKMRTMRTLVTMAVAIAIVAPGVGAQRRRRPAPRKPPVVKPEPPPPVSASLTIAPDLETRLARFKIVRMPFAGEKLVVREIRLVEKLVAAAQQLENIFWRQADPEAIALYTSLAKSTYPQDVALRRYLTINGGRFDLVDENKPFVGTEPMSAGRGLYPKGVTRAQLEAFVAAHPEKKDEIYSPYTVVVRAGDAFVGIPYRVRYKEFLDLAAEALRDAATYATNKPFAEFLRLRADALVSDDYYKSDLAWLDLTTPKFDVIMAPYETYLDEVLGVKTSYGAAVMIRNEAESEKLAVFQKHVADIQDALPLPPEDRPSVRGHVTPMEVMDTPFRSGDLRHGYQAVADNLPNDPRIHQQKGTKKIFFKNFMDARVNEVILPIAARLLRSDQASLASADGYMATTLMHEICHGLGPAFARPMSAREPEPLDAHPLIQPAPPPAPKRPRGPQTLDIREAIGPAYAGLEEAKADIVGLFALKWLVDRGVLPADRLNEYYTSEVAGIFRTVRFGTAEAHGRAEIMEFNYLVEKGAIAYDRATNRYALDFAKMTAAVTSLAKELLEQEAFGDRARVEAWFRKYGTMPRELAGALGAVADVPIDVDPIFSFREVVR
jgi:peptidase M49-like protein